MSNSFNTHGTLWIARDKDETLSLFSEYPYKNEQDGEWDVDFGWQFVEIEDEGYDDITWDSKPVEVAVIVKDKNLSNAEYEAKLDVANTEDLRCVECGETPWHVNAVKDEYIAYLEMYLKNVQNQCIAQDNVIKRAEEKLGQGFWQHE